MTKAVLIKPDNTVETINLADFKQAQELVGGYVEEVNLIGKDYILLVNEDGRMKNLPINKIASKIHSFDTIVGNAIAVRRGRNGYKNVQKADKSSICYMASLVKQK